MTKIEALELELKARKMAEGTGLNWWKLIKFAGSNNSVIDYAHLDRYNSEYLEFALGIIEGKPVWEGDEYYYNGLKYSAKRPVSTGYYSHCSWNPPEPKTVMVELLVEDVKAYTIHLSAITGSECPDGRLVEACRKALEEMK